MCEMEFSAIFTILQTKQVMPSCKSYHHSLVHLERGKCILSALLNQCCSRMLAYEKDRALMRTKVTDDEVSVVGLQGYTLRDELPTKQVWKRYEASMVENQMHDLRRTCLTLATNLLTVVLPDNTL